MFMRNCESAFSKKGMFFNGELRSSVRSLNGSENLGFSLLCYAYNYDIDASVCNLLELRRNKLFYS